MAKEQLDACILTSLHNIGYYSGFLYCFFGRKYAVVVTQDDHTTVSAGVDAGQPWRRCFGDNIIYTDWNKDNYFFVLKKLLNGKFGKIGVEFDHLSLDSFAKLQNALPQMQAVDVGVPTMRFRMVKSAEELDVIRNGARIADIGGFAAVEAITDGAPEHAVATHSTQAMVKEIAATYPQADLLDTWTWVQSGINTDGAHNPVTSRRIQPGDILNINCFPMQQGYYAALERTLFYKFASDVNLKMWEINLEVHEQGKSLLKAGAKCGDIANTLNEIYRKHDLLKYRSFGYGHSLGMMCHYYGREAALELREDIETVLEPNMVITMEPMITIPDGQPGAGGYREHDILIIHQDHTENITKFPLGPEKNIIKN